MAWSWPAWVSALATRIVESTTNAPRIQRTSFIVRQAARTTVANRIPANRTATLLVASTGSIDEPSAKIVQLKSATAHQSVGDQATGVLPTAIRLSTTSAAKKKIAAFEAKALTERVPALVATAQRAGAVRLVAENLGTLHSPDEVRMLVTATRAQLGSDPAVVALAAVVDDKPVIIVATNAAARETGQRAGALAKLVAGKGTAVRRRELIQTGWPHGARVRDNTLDAYVARLRRKLAALPGAPHITTVHGVGYTLE